MVLIYKKNNNNEYICPDCKFITTNQSTMHYHLRNHNGSLNHECSECNMKFLQKSVLELHIKSKHNDNVVKKDFACPCCDYSDLRKGNCVIHFARIHLKDITDRMKVKSVQENMIVECSECSKNFKNMAGFYYHLSSCIKLSANHKHYASWTKIH